MRFLAAFLFCFSVSLVWTACDKDDEVTTQKTSIDCSTINVADSTSCFRISNADSSTYVKTYLGTWYLAASQQSGFGGGSTDCLNFLEADSPISFSLNEDYTWRYVSTDPEIDTMLTWNAVSGTVGWLLMSSDQNYPIPQPRSMCGAYLVRDDRPLDGSLLVFAKAE